MWATIFLLAFRLLRLGVSSSLGLLVLFLPFCGLGVLLCVTNFFKTKFITLTISTSVIPLLEEFLDLVSTAYWISLTSRYFSLSLCESQAWIVV